MTTPLTIRFDRCAMLDRMLVGDCNAMRYSIAGVSRNRSFAGTCRRRCRFAHVVAQKHRYQRTQKCYMVGIFDMSQRLGL
jgi:hypothetical protein